MTPFEYTTTRRIALGGFATVHSAVHELSGHPVAIKVFDRRHDLASAHADMQREFLVAGRLTHPNIVRVFDFGTLGQSRVEGLEGLRDAPFICMELASEALGATRAPSWGTVLSALGDALDGLAYAHARGVVHCDVKPANILRFETPTGPTYKLSDFGIARVLNNTAGRAVAGTSRFMAPEQLMGARSDIGNRTDLFGLGCTALALVDPRQLRARPKRARLWNPRRTEAFERMPDGFLNWILTLTRPNPSLRFRTAAHARLALDRLHMPGSIEIQAPTDESTLR